MTSTGWPCPKNESVSLENQAGFPRLGVRLGRQQPRPLDESEHTMGLPLRGHIGMGQKREQIGAYLAVYHLCRHRLPDWQKSVADSGIGVSDL
jgi:hypothetical protein